jgi:hypothetical protein
MKMRKRTALFVIVISATLGLGVGISRAQEGTPPKAVETQKPAAAYHLEFALNELEDGKKINTRNYIMDVISEREGDLGRIRDIARDGKALKIGSRVPVESEQGKFQYIDVGTSIWCKLLEQDGTLTLDARAEVSSVLPITATDRYSGGSGGKPVLRQLQINSVTAIIPGKVTSLGTVDDPDSKRQFQLEVKVTKLR